jgi:hypothetical protein
MSQENEIEAETLSPTTDFLPSDGATCTRGADTRPKIVIDNVIHFMDGPSLSLSYVLYQPENAEPIHPELKP